MRKMVDAMPSIHISTQTSQLVKKPSGLFTRIVLIFAAFGFLGLTGCDDSVKDLANFVGGSYDGFLIQFLGDTSVQTFIIATLSRPTQTRFVIDVQNSQEGHDTRADRASAPNAFRFTFQGDSDGVTMASSLTPGQSFRLTSSGKQCFSTKDNAHWARLCYDKSSEVTIDLNDSVSARKFTLVINPKQRARIPVMEQPRSYTKSELVSHALKQSFSSRVEFEKVTQARLRSQNATLNLLPHFGLNTITNAISLSLSNIIKALSDVAPFLFPAKWIKAKAERFAYDAEFNSWITMKADAGLITEGLAYTNLETIESERVLTANKSAITLLRDQIKQREKTGVSQIGTSDDISAILNDIDQNINSLNLLARDNNSSLAQASGFFNPKAVANIVPTKEQLSVERPSGVDQAGYSRIALERSYEIRQLEDLIQVSRTDTTGRYFNFMDPNGDPDGEIGAGLPSYIQIGESATRELLNKRDEVQSIILEKIDQGISQIQEAESQWQTAYRGQLIADNRIARIQANIRLGISFEIADLVNAIQSKVQNDLQLVQAHYLYLVGWSKLNRLMYAGPYSQLARGHDFIPEFESDTGAPQAAAAAP